MFDIPFYTSNNEFQDHCKLRKALLERRDEFCCEENKFYGTGYSTIHTNDQIHKEYPDFNELLLQKQELFDPELVVTHCWVNINPQGGFQMRHNHAECDVAGTYYLQVPPGNTGDLFLYHPAHAVESLWRIRPYWPTTHCQIPREGDLYFWPGYQDHEVRMNEEVDERWTLSFMMSISDDVRQDRFPNLPRPR